MLKIGTFRIDIKKAIEEELDKHNNKFDIELLNKENGILGTDINILKGLEAVCTTHLTLEELELLPSLKTILVPMTGLDGIDESIVNNTSIEILSVHSTAPYIAERGMGILMTLAGKISLQSEKLKVGKWSRFGESGKWLTLRDKKVGIYGYGHIGKEFEKMIRPFSENIYTINRNKQYPNDVNLVNNLDELTKISDILFIAVPGNSQTEGSISTKELNNMKDGLIVNVGRGKVVNAKALYESLKEEEIGGYGSDVWYNYPDDYSEICFASDENLGEFEHMIMTPHNAWNHDHRDGLVVDEIVGYVKKLIY